jgi:hypothetical protein
MATSTCPYWQRPRASVRFDIALAMLNVREMDGIPMTIRWQLVSVSFASRPGECSGGFGSVWSTDRGYRRPCVWHCARRYPGYWGVITTGDRYCTGRGCWHRHDKTPIIKIRQMDAAPATGSDVNWCLVAQRPMALVDSVHGQGTRVVASPGEEHH